MKLQKFTGKDKLHYFRIVARNGKIICHSEAYNSKQARTKTIKSLLKAFAKVVAVEDI